MSMAETITISAIVAVPRARVWELWTEPVHIVHWCFASDDWHAPRAENDLLVGGRFVTRMEARDGSRGFDFAGTYTEVIAGERLALVLGDGRVMTVTFADRPGGTEVTETLEVETENPVKMQRDGSQAILENFRKYAEMSPSALVG